MQINGSNQISIQEANPTPGIQVPFQLGVKVSTTNGPLQYGPTSGVFELPKVDIFINNTETNVDDITYPSRLARLFNSRWIGPNVRKNRRFWLD